jgi:hypothetical protein
MSPLEHRYRRLLQLLPETHRAARGEELLGLLLDLDDGRTRPSTRQAVGLIGLAIRLRLGNLSTAGNVLFSAFLVAYGTAEIGQLIDFYSGGSTAVVISAPAHFSTILLASALGHLAVTIAWILGARYAAVALQAVAIAALPVGYLLVTRHALVADLLATVSVGLIVELALLSVLAVAARQRWTTPKSPVLWLVVVALAVLAWKAVGTWGRHGMHFLILPSYISWVAAAIVASTAVFLLRRRRWPIVVAGALVGFGIGKLLPSTLLQLAYGRYTWMVSIAVGTFLLVGGTMLTRRLLNQPGTSNPRDNPLID